MANKTFDALTALSAPATGDLVAIADVDASNEAKKTTVGELATVVGTELGLGTAATTASTDYATAAQGAKADLAVLSSDSSITEVIQLTQGEYDTLVSGPGADPNTIYVITGGDVTVTANVQGAATNIVNRIVTIDQAAYDTLVAGAGPDANTLYVIEDGVTKDSYNGQIDTPAASKTYYLDADVVSARTITGIQMFYTSGASGAGTVTLNVGADSTNVYTFVASQTAQPLGGPVSLAAAENDQISLTMSGTVADVTDFLFVLEYEV